MQRGLTFDDVALLPQYNDVPSRTEPNLSTWLTRNIEVGMPLVPANMDSVIGLKLAEIVIANGGVPILHRFASLQEQQTLLEALKGKAFISAGLNKWEETQALLKQKPIGVCFDIAHGHSKMLMDAIQLVKSEFPNCEVIAGNVCTSQGYQDLAYAGADAVKVGIGPGAACTTRIVTGFGAPQFTAIQQCAEAAKKRRVPIIADGGVRGSRDLVLALAAGASTVMLGSLFALTEDSAAEKRAATSVGAALGAVGYENPPMEARYRGQASSEFQEDYYGGMKPKTVAEGIEMWKAVSGPAQDLIDELLGGLRSGLTYGGARSIKELQRKAEFMEVTSTYSAESNPRK